ncbi:hypothetical protein SPRG_08079 [Saprolegnia parasitica CBS 223.65]|uniref:Uncharacterized protein n=1 Tax=Saprolegnia parasitica (strain CBS 223.65) TaxID=695850 RepID=A0A067C7Q5_SAPPC|nr:hypothetical protein SPRG_08079 [Saprolegnia parasitica CBS 223.65]KDO26789.1 hypothetical protein SPRG_08079 [Saprolegnia parasitica CBS 223.65]|eukprot:XP_012202437.1 hypothetical protein SPRG_08079 [Saprolegnia parasitica CBS 223.65]
MADPAMAFHEHIAAFYMALAEEKLDGLVDALQGLREAAKAAAASPESALLEEARRYRTHHAATHRHQKAITKGPAAVQQFGDFVLPKTGALNKRRPVASEDLAGQLKDLEDDLLCVLNAFYTAQTLDSTDASLRRLRDYMAADASQRGGLRLDQFKRLKLSAKLNADGYIDRHIHLEALTGLFQDASHLLQYIEQTVWPHQVAETFAPLHKTILDIVLDVLAMYGNDARLLAWERKIGMNTGTVEADESLQMIDLLLDELATILQWGFQYSAAVVDVASHPGLSTKIHELNGVYLLLEQFYIAQSVRKAVAIAEPEEVEPHVFEISTVQDTSFVLDKAFARANQSSHYHTVLAIVIAIVEALDGTFMPSILALPDRSFELPLPVASPRATTEPAEMSTGDDEKSFGDALLEVVEMDLTAQLQRQAKMMMAINSAHKSSAYVDTLHARLEEGSFPPYPPLLECLPKALSELQADVGQVITIGTQELYAIQLQAKLRGFFEASISQWQFELDLDSFEYFDVHDSPLLRLVHQVLREKALRRFRRGLNSVTFERLWRAVVTDLCQWIEDGIQTKQFNEWGAMQLDRDVRSVMQLCAKFPTEPISLLAEFTRLDQIVLLVNMVQASDVLEYDSIRSTLSVAEIEARLTLRFRKAALARSYSNCTPRRLRVDRKIRQPTRPRTNI